MKTKLILIFITILLSSHLEAIPTKFGRVMRDWLYEQDGEVVLIVGSLIDTIPFETVLIETEDKKSFEMDYDGLSDRDKHYLDTIRKKERVR